MGAYNLSSTEAQGSGLRAYLLKIYNYMTGALILTGAIAFYSAKSEALLNAMYIMQGETITGMKSLAWIVMFAPLGLVMFLSFGIQRMSLYTAQLSFWAYAALVGLSLSVIFLTFTGESIAQTLFITAGTFGGMSLYGYTTQRDLTGMGSFMFMGLIGLIIASMVNLFLKSPGLQFGLSVAGVIVFVGLTAFDTQKLKQLYVQTMGEGEGAEKIAIIGALTLYLDFINIFLNLLNFFGKRKR
ncbi:MAG: Bax inhibitor-1/YccA family protein [Proteobacteria bacterium]|nr:Bax inhibitor-1/YccA family protein [Pseudomonadota bacterium]